MSHTCYHPAFEQADIRYALGVDGGGTGTRVRVWTSAGALVGHGESGPSALAQGVDQAWRHIGQAVERAFASAGLAMPAPSHCVLGLGLAGAVAPHLAAAFFRAAPEYALIVLETDSRTALMGAHGGRPGAIIAVEAWKWRHGIRGSTGGPFVLPLCVGIVTLWLDGPLEGRCVSLGTTPERLTADIARQLEFLLTAGGSGAAKRRTNRR